MIRIKDLKNCRIDDNNNITVKMVKMGMNIDETRNHRIRGIVQSSNGDYLFVEIQLARRPSRSYFSTSEQKKLYDEKYTTPEYIHVDSCFRVDVPEDYFNNYSIGYKKESFTKMDYTNENITKVLKSFNKNIIGIELVDENYIDKFCAEKGFFKLYDDRLDYIYEPVEILNMTDRYIRLKMHYSCWNHDKTVKYEKYHNVELYDYKLEELEAKYGSKIINDIVNKYNQNNKSYDLDNLERDCYCEDK